MTRPPPQPVFVHRGFSGGAVSCAIARSTSGDGILVGTGEGRCELYDADTHTFIRTVYVDDEQRSISSVGLLNGFIWVHVRNHAVIMLDANDCPQLTLELSHCGFCMAMVMKSWIIYPDTVAGKHFLKFWSNRSESRNPVPVKDLPIALISNDDFIFIGDEAGTLLQISDKEYVQKQVRLFSEPIFCLATTSSTLACGSSKPPILMLSTNDILGERRKVHYPQTSQGVGSMAFSTSGKTLIAGFWDGSIRAFSVRKLTVLLYLNLHNQTISQILWNEVNGEDLVIAASKDEKLSLWKF